MAATAIVEHYAPTCLHCGHVHLVAAPARCGAPSSRHATGICPCRTPSIDGAREQAAYRRALAERENADARV